MLKKFQVKNYRTFKDEISIDFGNIGGYQFSSDCITNGIISKMLIYGRNATGKTNLGRAVMDIISLLGVGFFMRDSYFLNADSDDDCAMFSYTFQFNEDELIYVYLKNANSELYKEQLFINNINIFSYDFIENIYSYDNLEKIYAETVVLDRYFQAMQENDNSEDRQGPLPFLRWLISNTALKGDSVLLKLNDYVRRMLMVTVGNVTIYRPKRMFDNFFELLNDKKELEAFENFLNVMGIECKLVTKKLPDGQNELYFKHKKLVPFYETASSGTISLMNLYRRFVATGKEPSLLYFDEFDAFYHYEMAENVVRFFKKEYPSCQVILTSHNTNLMTNRLLRPDCLFILSQKGMLTPLCNATLRELREGHNLEKMYISGEFEKYE